MWGHLTRGQILPFKYPVGFMLLLCVCVWVCGCGCVQVPLRRIPVEDIGLLSLIPPPSDHISSAQTSPSISEVISQSTEPLTKSEGSRDLGLLSKDMVTIAASSWAGETVSPLNWSVVPDGLEGISGEVIQIKPHPHPVLMRWDCFALWLNGVVISPHRSYLLPSIQLSCNSPWKQVEILCSGFYGNTIPGTASFL